MPKKHSPSDRILAEGDNVTKAMMVWQHYQRSRLLNDLEPEWIHAAYEEVKRFLDGELHWSDVSGIVNSHAAKDGSEDRSGPIPRVMHDGWKVGTSTWVFMGRAAEGAASDLGGGWVAVCRRVPKELAVRNMVRPGWAECWIAYHRKLQMGYTALTANCVEAMTLDELKGFLREDCGACEGTGFIEGIGGRQVACLHPPE